MVDLQIMKYIMLVFLESSFQLLKQYWLIVILGRYGVITGLSNGPQKLEQKRNIYIATTLLNKRNSSRSVQRCVSML